MNSYLITFYLIAGILGTSAGGNTNKNVRKEYDDLFDSIQQKVQFSPPSPVKSQKPLSTRLVVEAVGGSVNATVAEGTSAPNLTVTTGASVVSSSAPTSTPARVVPTASVSAAAATTSIPKSAVSSETTTSSPVINATASPQTQQTLNSTASSSGAQKNSSSPLIKVATSKGPEGIPASSKPLPSDQKTLEVNSPTEPKSVRSTNAKTEQKVALKYDEDNEESDEGDLPRHMQPNIFDLLLSFRDKVVAVPCESNADCVSSGSSCSKLLNRCSPTPQTAEARCYPKVCSKDSDCCEGETCDDYQGILAGRTNRCRSAYSKKAASPKEVINVREKAIVVQKPEKTTEASALIESTTTGATTTAAPKTIQRVPMESSSDVIAGQSFASKRTFGQGGAVNVGDGVAVAAEVPVLPPASENQPEQLDANQAVVKGASVSSIRSITGLSPSVGGAVATGSKVTSR